MAAAALPQSLLAPPPRISTLPDPPPTPSPNPAANPYPLHHARELHASGQLLHAAEAYRQTLITDPRNQSALLGLSLIARQSKQALPALRMARAAIATGPANAIVWANYADTLAALGKPALAQPAYQRAIALDSSIAPAHYGLGNSFASQTNYAAALTSFETAVHLAPGVADFHFALAFTLGKLGRHTDAASSYHRAITLRPSFPSAWLNLGVELVADGRSHLAAPCYGQAIATATPLGPRGHATRISAHLNLGHLARSHRRYDEAQLQYERALTLADDLKASTRFARLAEVHIAFACLHLDRKQFPQAWQSLREAEASDTQSNPNHPNPEIANTRGILLLAEHTAAVASDVPEPYTVLLEEAIEAFAQAESAGHNTAASNRGNTLLRLGHCDEALAAHQAAIDRDPHHAGARYNLALTQLRMGNFTHGWPNYEIRWSFRDVHPRPRRFPQPRWHGEPLAESSTLFLYAEQGLGDTIQFFRYLPLSAERAPGSSIVVEVQAPLLRLLQGFAEQTSTATGTKIHLIPQGSQLPAITHHCPLMSLPALFGTTLDSISATIPYLYADPQLVRIRAAELAHQPTDSSQRVGINWAGNPNYRADHERSTHLKTFHPLLALPNIHWVSLQKGKPAEEMRGLPPNLHLQDLGSHDRDLADTAAVIANLDLVITTDTAVAHLAGALGKPLWLLLPWQSDWRWMQECPCTPWYPQARLFRQSSPCNWQELMQRVGRELSKSTSHCPPCTARCDTTKSA
ncbi:tetratricopeptide repeat protein [Acidicapsa dinghuensis]|uniref:Tetratricopeptide repeat protein n=1 Tax=Acidicapsa dinghuensis TaxID=2218256 RepID=A0ABW1EJE8_9BACT|nr:tetratricopeptide repeat protein [Acidicapsa dinghuensis]